MSVMMAVMAVRLMMLAVFACEVVVSAVAVSFMICHGIV
jgi:hypothetical protein